MTREQTLRLAKSVKGISVITQNLLTLSQELLSTPKDAVEIAEPTAAIALCNGQLMEVARKHSKQYINEHTENG